MTKGHDSLVCRVPMLALKIGGLSDIADSEQVVAAIGLGMGWYHTSRGRAY